MIPSRVASDRGGRSRRKKRDEQHSMACEQVRDARLFYNPMMNMIKKAMERDSEMRAAEHHENMWASPKSLLCTAGAVVTTTEQASIKTNIDRWRELITKFQLAAVKEGRDGKEGHEGKGGSECEDFEEFEAVRMQADAQ